MSSRPAAAPRAFRADAFTRPDGLPAVPIVLGVVGHRRIAIEHQGILKSTLTTIFREFRKAYSQSPLVLVSPLAQGADQIGAEAALEAGAFVRAPLPFEPDLYRRSSSFDTEEDRIRFDTLLNDARVEWFVPGLPDGYADESTNWEKVVRDKDPERIRNLRHVCYANAGGYLVRRCHLLIALWEGPEEPKDRGPSGTREYVEFKHKGKLPEFFPWGPAEPLGFRGDRGLVLIVHTPRPGEPATERAVGSVRVLVPNEGDELVLADVVLPPEDPRPASATHGRAGGVRVVLPELLERTSLAKKDVPLAGRLTEGSRFWARVGRLWRLGRHSSDESPPKPPKSWWKRIPWQAWQSTTKWVQTTAARSWSLVRRQEYPPSGERLRRRGWRRAVDGELRQFHEVCTSIDEFNVDLRSPRVAKDLGRRVDRLPKTLPLDEFDEQYQRWLLRLCRLREAGAALSNDLQKPLDWMLRAVYILVGLGLVAFHLFAHLTEGGHHNLRYLDAYALLLLGMWGVVWFVWWFRVEERRLDSRALAEGLRVRRMWSLAGVGVSVADSYPGQLRSEVSWIRKALLHACPPPRVWARQFAQLPPDRQIAVLRHVREDWFHKEGSGQITQFAKRHRDRHWRATLYRLLGFVLGVVGWFLLAGVLLASQWATAPERPNNPWERWELIVPSLLVIAGGLFIAYNERRTHEELANQYERMHLVFQDGDRELAAHLEARDVAAAQGVLEALGREALAEHSQWLVLRRARALEVHIGG
jgi:hypothetical protein